MLLLLRLGFLPLATFWILFWPSFVVGTQCTKETIPTYMNNRTGQIMSPNFPDKFETPYCGRWVIDSGPYDANDQKFIHIYYTQPYFKDTAGQNLIVAFHDSYPYLLQDPTKTRTKTRAETKVSLRKVKRGAAHEHPHNLNGPLVAESASSPKQRYMSVEIRIDSLYNTHFRTRERFLYVYGFNFTYIINNVSTPIPGTERCSIYNCSAAGDCYAAPDYRSFSCGCHEGRSGKFCQYGAICDPKTNSNPCHNGGHCQAIATGSVRCLCLQGFIGHDCGRRNFTTIKSCPGPDCLNNCTVGKDGGISPSSSSGINIGIASSRPCSCYKGNRRINLDWVRYLGEFLFSFSTPNANANITQENNTTSSNSNNSTYNYINNSESASELDSKSQMSADVENTIRYIKSSQIQIESKLTQILSKLVPALQKMDNVSITVFTTTGSNSKFDDVHFRFQFQFFGPPGIHNETQLGLESIIGEEIYPGIRLESLDKFHQLPKMALENLSMRPGGTIKVDDNFSITCSATGSTNVTIKWFKDDISIDATLALWGRIAQMHRREEDDFKSTSTLNFDRAHVNDQGKFTCQVSDADEDQCKDFEMVILTKPVITVKPLSLTLMKNTSDTVIICTAALDGGRSIWNYDWRINGVPISRKNVNEVKEELFPRGSLLRIINAQLSKTYSCVVTNDVGESSVYIQVEVLDSVASLSCARQVDMHRLKWDVTAPNQTVKRPCPIGYLGFIQRTCHLKPDDPVNAEWGQPDFTNCLCRKLITIHRSINNAKLGFTKPSHMTELVAALSIYLLSRDFLYLGEGERIKSILNEIGTYALDKDNGTRTNTQFLEHFLNASSIFLEFQETCIFDSTVISMNNLIYKIAENYSSSSNSNSISFQSDSLILEELKISLNSTFIYPDNPHKSYSPWLKFELEVPSPNPTNSNSNTSNIILLILRNLTYPTISRQRTLNSGGSPYFLISPLVYINSTNYKFTPSKNITLRFKISPYILTKHAQNISCASLDNNYANSGSTSYTIRWTIDACDRLIYEMDNQTVECRCSRFGQFGLLIYSRHHVEIRQTIPLHWFVIFGCTTCIVFCGMTLAAILIYSQWQLITNSIYPVKAVMCLSIIISLLFILSMPAETPSMSTSTSACTFIILSLACHLTKSMKIFSACFQIQVFPWLGSIPLLNLLVGITFACVLPIWISAAAMMYYATGSSTLPAPQSVFHAHSPTFAVFVATLAVIFILFLIIYFKATLQLHADRGTANSSKAHMLNYRIKTLNRSLAIILSTITTTILAILHKNTCNAVAYQYMFGLSTINLGIVIFLSYTLHSEYPIPGFITDQLSFIQPPSFPDPEKPSSKKSWISETQKNLTTDKSFHRTQNAQMNRRQRLNESKISSGPETSMETLRGSSSRSITTSRNRISSSSSSTKRPSFSSRSRLNNKSKKCLSSFNSDSSNFESAQNERILRVPLFSERQKQSSASSSAMSMVNRPERGKCLLRETGAVTSVHVPISQSSRALEFLSNVSIKYGGDCEYVEPSLGPKRSRIGDTYGNPTEKQEQRDSPAIDPSSHLKFEIWNSYYYEKRNLETCLEMEIVTEPEVVPSSDHVKSSKTEEVASPSTKIIPPEMPDEQEEGVTGGIAN